MTRPGFKAIISRHKRFGKTYRSLECGHQVLERSGGGTDLALTAFCTRCTQQSQGVEPHARVTSEKTHTELRVLIECDRLLSAIQANESRRVIEFLTDKYRGLHK